MISPVFPISFVLLNGAYIAYSSEQRVYEDNPILFIFTFGLIASKITNKLIVRGY